MESKEIPIRFVQITNFAKQDGVEPDEYVKRIFQQAVRNGNPFINPDFKFVVLGIDGFSGGIFPSGYFDTEDEAFSYVVKKKSEEIMYSEGDEISTTFHIFTMEGTHVPNSHKTPPPKF